MFGLHLLRQIRRLVGLGSGRFLIVPASVGGVFIRA